MSSYTVPSVVERTANGSERVTDVFSRLVSERIVYVGTPINDDVANVVIAQLMHLESQAPDLPIDLVINSSGGSEFAALAVYDTLRYVRCPIAATVVGQAVGASALLLAGADRGRRMLLPHARVVLHQLNAESRGAIPDLILQAEEVLRIRGQFEQILAERTGQSLAALRSETDRELVLTAQAAVEFGLADEVLGARGARGVEAGRGQLVG
ncbi:ClpP family protease [Galactobacter caseinivorans]|uniref:ATP-dependent Clp protease proteolytic subunit n=1 Tax=Galactobacter caseinivorans TaxID=2676123 RepID=A0A496PHF6_9MICC|nr:ATP-dependent Clp protease proteolytic subunit [Galactobacter caseinivorans]RKW69914.1 ATP-dependent Clp protease proteolytic subunit [Galactobacter caseinivorans]